MKSFIDYILISEEEEPSLRQMMGKTYKGGQGDCYEAAFHWVLALDEGAIKHASLCHGMVHGQGPLEGKKFGHAWGEMGNFVFDHSNGKQLTMRKTVYYAAGKIDEAEVFCYPGHKSLGKAARAKHYGPWDMTGATVDVSVSRAQTEGKRIKAIIKRLKEIGKRKVKISRDILATISKMKQ
jgi:hypothetical protein